MGLDIDKHLAISAGAGTGKTSVMALRYIEHLLNIEQRATVLLPSPSRRPLHGPGSLRSPKREQVNLREWTGLLPSECVAITFTNDAADELKHRIRTLLLEKKKQKDDPRINKEGLIDQMLSLIDDAPIGTIDSFFSTLLRPWMALVNESPTNENVSDEIRPLLTKDAIKIAWRIRNEKDFFEAGLKSDFNNFLNSRNRLSLGLGGRFTAERVLGELLNQSLFVEESESKINQLCEGESNKSDAIVDYVKKMILKICKFGLTNLDELYDLGFNWLNGCTKFSKDLNLDAALKNNTRYSSFDDLIRSGIPTDDWEKLLWFSHFEFITTSQSAYNKMSSKSSSMPLGMLPNRDKSWPSGINPRSSIKGHKNNEKSKIEIKEIGEEISRLLSTPEFVKLRRISRCAWFFDPIFGCPKHPEGPLRGSKIITELGTTPPEKTLIASKQLQIKLLEDLFTVQHGIQSILRNIKNLRGVHDYSDIQRLSEDLLLARCPDICRFWYPKKVINSLDNLSRKPWEDHHIENALFLSQDDNEVFKDLSHRFDILKSLRRRFRTFIIDEYQDTNPQQYRLLCRLFGRRKLEIGEPAPPESPWDPTVCIVGDLKQSIFRFRQAQVTVMLKTISIIKEINENEISKEVRLIHLRKKQGVKEGYGRDPRPIPSKFKTNKFQTGKTFENKFEGSNEMLLTCKLGDNDEILDFETQLERRRGHLKLSTNYRTKGALLMTLNEIFEDLFSEKNDLIDGDWYARAQKLLPSNDLKYERGKIEWILPTSHEKVENQNRNLKIPLSPFVKNNLSKPYEREYELLCARLFGLIHGHDSRLLINSQENTEWVKLPNDEKINPEDIMILVQKRTHISELMQRLSNWGIPAVIDKQSGLLDRPIVKALYDLLNSAIYPNNKTIFSSLLRSELMCFSDNQLHNFIKKWNVDSNLFDLLLEEVEDDGQKHMIGRWKELSSSRHFVTLLEDTLDYSDLLTIYSSSEDRQLAEQFISIVSKIFTQVNSSGILLMSYLESLKDEGIELPVKTTPLSGAVRVMTIHASKGLQSKVVVLCGLFDETHHSLTNITRKRLVVTPELMASELKPWISKEGIKSGMWELSKLLTRSQIQAETRRLLYVALTRVQSHLILVGGKHKTPATISGKNEIIMDFKTQENPSLGEMIFSGLAHNSVNNDESPWARIFSENKLTLNPAKLYHDSFFKNGLKSISIYHSLECFPKKIVEETPYTKIQNELDLLNSSKELLEEINNEKVRKIKLNIAPYRLDIAGKIVNSDCSEICKIKQWKNINLGFEYENLLSYIKKDNMNKKSKFPSPADFGTMFHRLVEVGIGNPSLNNNSDLPSTWKRRQESKLLNPKVISNLITELLPIDADRNITEKRLKTLAELFEKGPLGMLCSGDVIQGLKIDGLLTEMPFEYTMPLDLVETGINVWTPDGIRTPTKINSAEISFSGRIDLVLALSDESNKKYLMAIDIKTEGSLNGFSSKNPIKGTSLQQVLDESDSRFKKSRSEIELLSNHSFQLGLYNHVLNSIQLNSGSERVILPPCIYVAASGRLISWDEKNQEIKQDELKNLLNWMVKSLVNEPYNPVSLIDNVDKCKNCVYDIPKILLKDGIN